MTGMRVGFLLEQCLAPVPGGTGRYSVELAAALAASAPGGAEVTGWTAWHRDTAPARAPGVTGPRRLPLGRRALAAGWERGTGPAPRAADVVHAPTVLVPPRRGRPLVVTIHDAVPWTHPQTLTRRGVAFHRRMAGRAAREADLVTAPSAATAADLARYLPLDPARVLVLGAGVPSGWAVPPDAEERAARLRLPTGGYFATLSTLEPRKGLDVAIAALACPQAPDVPLVVVGPAGWGRVDPAGLAAGLGLPAHRVRRLGAIPDGDLAVVLARSLALVVPSRAEGFGLQALEAMALGTPVISTDVPALAELGGGATMTVPPDDPAALAGALAAVAADDILRTRMSAAGVTRAGAYSWAAAADKLWTAYGGLCSPVRRGRFRRTLDG